MCALEHKRQRGPGATQSAEGLWRQLYQCSLGLGSQPLLLILTPSPFGPSGSRDSSAFLLLRILRRLTIHLASQLCLDNRLY